jgi:hypothetical protein
MAGGDEAAGWSAPRGRPAGSRGQGIPIRRAGSGAQPDAARRRRETCILPLPQGRAAPLGAGALDARGGEAGLVDAHGPHPERAEDGPGVVC